MTGASATDDARIHRRVGAPHQLVSVARVVLDEGTARGAPALVIRNPAGISMTVLIDRCLDIDWADACGIPLAWRSPLGPVASARHEAGGHGWARTFGGGLLSTCGLSSTGAPSTVDGIHHGLHGRIGHVPAERVSYRHTTWDGSRALEIRGQMVEGALGMPTLRLHRRLLLDCHRPRLRIEDTVINDGYTEAGHMFRHHINLGYPLVDDGTVVSSDTRVVGERDDPGIRVSFPLVLTVSEAPEPERVLYASPLAGSTTAQVRVRGARATMAVVFGTDGFDHLVLWRDASPGVNVLGVEPSTSRDSGRARAAADGELIRLAHGQSRAYWTEIHVRTDDEDPPDQAAGHHRPSS